MNKIRKEVLLFLFFWAVIRICAVALLWWHLIYGYCINIFLDAIDGDIIYSLGVKRSFYQQYDKWLDFWFYIALMFYSFLYFIHEPIWIFLLGTFIYRLIGQILYSLTDKEWILMVFPNFFSDLFIIWVIWPGFFQGTVGVIPNTYIVVIFLMVFVMVREWLLHVRRFGVREYLLKKAGFWH